MPTEPLEAGDVLPLSPPGLRPVRDRAFGERVARRFEMLIRFTKK